MQSILYSRLYTDRECDPEAIAMLRITNIQNDASVPVLKLEGKLLEPWVGELHEACRGACGPLSQLTLDLAGLSFVDSSGASALHELQHRGISLTGCSPLVAELLKENNT